MNNPLFIIIFWMLAFSCKAPVSSLDQGRVALVSAEKSEWSGGRPGIRGAVYTVFLKPQDRRDQMTVTSFKAEGHPISFMQSRSGNSVMVRGSFQITDETKGPDYSDSGSSVEKSEPSVHRDPEDSQIEYTVKGSEKIYQLRIPAFIPAEPEGELIPRRQ
ncbi:hypothetical protein [Chryseobacterium hagamense]|uniref:Uncharacterized protein n=1 Tax=Chryseobacterium hagamense TaxID=395935 RepID=A0A511YLJ2_9FLAO|nr:hypothetical protein [Chryseobacterium hagamense]GEN76078.1 hypothetical protein CHA01nite_18180 [Chryseobacterium hagamense]